MFWKLFWPTFAVVTALVFDAPLAAHATQETLTPISQVTFVASPKWYVLKAKALGGDVLVFRKYSLVVVDEKIANIKNIFDVGCQRTKAWDYLVFHFPDWASFETDKEIVGIRICVSTLP